MVKYTGRGLVVKRPGVLSKVQMLNLVLGVGVFSLLPKKSTNPNFCFQISSGGVGGLARETGGGQKQFGMSFETQGNQTSGRDIPGYLPGYPAQSARKFERKIVCVQILAPTSVEAPNIFQEQLENPIKEIGNGKSSARSLSA